MRPGKKTTRTPGAANPGPVGENQTAAPGVAETSNTSTAGGGGKPAFDPTDVLKGFAKSTSRVVQQAASILEEEIAAGIVAAKQVEERFVNVSKVRSEDPAVLIQRFRRDTHEVVDIIIDLVNAGAKSVGDLAQRAVRIRSDAGSSKVERLMAGQVPTLSMPQPVKAGAAAEITMSVENDSDAETAKFSFCSSDLVSSTGDRIDNKHVRFDPTSLVLATHRSTKVKATVQVPAETPAGVYAGLIQATNLNHLRASISVAVG